MTYDLYLQNGLVILNRPKDRQTLQIKGSMVRIILKPHSSKLTMINFCWFKFHSICTTKNISTHFLPAKPDMKCPGTHPFAFHFGEMCCETNKETVYPTWGCYGGKLTITSKCCDGNSTVCQDPTKPDLYRTCSNHGKQEYKLNVPM